MYLTKRQERMLMGEYGWVYAKALEIIVKVGEVLGADSLVPVKHVHVSGISYSNIGEHGLEFIRKFYSEGGYRSAYTTVNPGCVDLSKSSRVIGDQHFDKQLEINSYLERMGFSPTYTCIPYLHRRPALGEHLAWGESSAVIAANSVFGARTNREGGPLTIASAITGYTYRCGLHLDSERTFEVAIDARGLSREHYGALGLWIGENVAEKPCVRNVLNDFSSIKLMLAAAAASGDHGLIVLDGVTPRRSYLASEVAERVSVELADLEKYSCVDLDLTSSSSVLGYIGCPHLDPLEFSEAYSYIVNKFTREGCEFRGKLLISVPYIYGQLFGSEIETLRKVGVDVALGTCPIVSSLRGSYDLVLTNSGKAYFYLKRLKGARVCICPFEKIVDYVCGSK